MDLIFLFFVKQPTPPMSRNKLFSAGSRTKGFTFVPYAKLNAYDTEEVHKASMTLWMMRSRVLWVSWECSLYDD